MSILPPLSEVHLPDTLKEEDIEILKHPEIQLANGFSIANVFIELFTSSRHEISNLEELQLISCHPTRGIVAVIFHSTVIIYSLDDLLRNSKPSPTVLKYLRFDGKILSFSWTYENQSTFLVGTTKQLYYIELSSYQTDSTEIGAADFHQLDLPSSIPIDQITVSPQGRYCACRSSAKKGCILIIDTWQNHWQYYYVFNSWTAIKEIAWTLTGQNILVTTSGGEVLLIDTYRWQKQSFFLTQDTSSPSFHGLQWITAQSLLCILPSRNEIYRLYLEESLADCQLSQSNDPYQMNNILHLNTHPYTINTQHHREGLMVQNMSTSLDGDYVAVQYYTPNNNKSSKNQEPPQGESSYPQIDIFLVQKESVFSLTYIRTISKHIPSQILFSSSTHTTQPRPAAVVYPLSTVFVPSSLSKGRYGGVILLILWSDVTVTSHKI